MSRSFITRFVVVLMALTLPVAAFAGSVGKPSGGGSYMEWQLNTRGQDRVQLTVLDEAGGSVVLNFQGGQNPQFRLKDLGGNVADGQYTYELRAFQAVPQGVQKQLEKARADGDDATIKSLTKQYGLGRSETQYGVITVLNGQIVSPEGKEPEANDEAAAAAAASRFGNATTNGLRPEEVVANTQVIAEDLVVQGSECVGFDCSATEAFGFDTVRLKENNLRIHFDDTSSTAGYPANDWRLIANDSGSGGASYFALEDATAARNPFLVEAGAPASTLYVDSTGRIGIQQSAPVLDLHITTGNTPATRLEQTTAGGFTAQTWDIGANEANFFVRDVTGGSKLPFRLRPGAPTSSIDVSASGNVGIGTASPAVKLDVQGTIAISNGGDLGIGTTTPAAPIHILDTVDPATGTLGRLQNNSATGFSGLSYFDTTGTTRMYLGTDNANSVARVAAFGTWPMVMYTNNTERLRIDSSGRIGIGVTSPTNPIQHSNGAYLSSTGSWVNASSRELKQDIETLTSDEALETLNGLAPVKYNYKIDPSDAHVGFIAEDVPELVAEPTRKGLSALDVTAVLAKVVQDQQKQIEALTRKIEDMEKNK